MKYVIAVAVCSAEFLAYAAIGVLLGWKSGGGIIPMMILLAIVGATWRGITKSGGEPESEQEEDEGAQPEN